MSYYIQLTNKEEWLTINGNLTKNLNNPDIIIFDTEEEALLFLNSFSSSVNYEGRFLDKVKERIKRKLANKGLWLFSNFKCVKSWNLDFHGNLWCEDLDEENDMRKEFSK